jgi:hydroxyacylglutathione hydrolase
MPSPSCHIEVLPALEDNYIYLLRWPDLGCAVVVDPGESGPVVARLAETGETLTHILNTHHHNDHIGGNAALVEAYGAQLIGPVADQHRIAGIDLPVRDGDHFELHGLEVTVIDTPGHTVGHVAFYIPGANALFSGDTLFALGCGRLFEGSAAQMWAAMQELRALPGATLVYCGHEYTQSNLRYAQSVDPVNTDLAQRGANIMALREQGYPTIPFRLDEDCATNPFLRADNPALAAALGMVDADPVDVFAKLRSGKNTFR